MKHKNMSSQLVEVKNGNIDAALDIFNYKLKVNGLWKELKRRRYYTKPSAIRYMRKKNILKYGILN